MIIAKINGGLGNQMFQYSFAKYWAIKKNVLLGVNLDSYKGNNIDSLNRRVMHLQDFNTQFKIVNSNKIGDYLFITGNKFIDDYFLLKLKFLHKKAFFEGQNISKLKKVKDVCLVGHFIRDYINYIQEIKPVLKKEFTLKDKSRILKLLNKIKKGNSVSIHVRRGDLIRIRNTKVLDRDYYKKAIKIVNKNTKGLNYYVFSDDMEWCKKNFSFLKNVFFVEGNSVSEDFELMKSCKHNIMANSTLSWWATYLNKNKNKIIIQPKHMGSFVGDSGKGLQFEYSKKL